MTDSEKRARLLLKFLLFERDGVRYNEEGLDEALKNPFIDKVMAALGDDVDRTLTKEESEAIFSEPQ